LSYSKGHAQYGRRQNEANVSSRKIKNAGSSSIFAFVNPSVALSHLFVITSAYRRSNSLL